MFMFNVYCTCTFMCLHCNENSIYVFLFQKLPGLSPNFHIHVSVSVLYNPRSVHKFPCSRIGRSIVGIYKSLTDTRMLKLKLGLWPRNSFSESICFEFSVLCLCSVENAGLLHDTYSCWPSLAMRRTQRFVAKIRQYCP
jgi:hypothetical protein